MRRFDTTVASNAPPQTDVATSAANPHETKDAVVVRADIQALRALAIALVVVYHLWPGRLTGGFVGVDVFFVVSGYLITAHLIRDVLKNGRISLTRFWSRRARRLLPAAFVVLLFCIPIAIFVLRPQSEQNLWEIAAAALYVENWALALNSVDYLAAANSPSLVQHFWSLSTEEQFYVLWPLLIAGAAILATRLRKRPLTVLTIVLAVVFIASLLHSVVITFDRPAQAYFLTTARAWEFAAGGLAALIPLKMLSRATSHSASAILGWIGLAMIAASAVLYSSSTPFPGFAASLPVVGTLLVLTFGQAGSALSVAAVSDRKPVLLLGDISYGLYLWHWPLIILATSLLGGQLALLPKLVVIVVACLTAYWMKRLVEDPARFTWTWMQTTRGAFGVMAGGMALICILAAGALLYQRSTHDAQFASIAEGPCVGAGAMDPLNECSDIFAMTSLMDTSLAAQDVYWREGSVQAGGVCSPRGAVPSTCILGSRSDPVRTIAFIGSSHGQHLLDPVHRAAEGLGWKVLPHVRARCSGFDSPEQIEARITENPSVADDLRECQAWSDAMYAQILKNPEVSVVVISARSVGATPFTKSRVDALLKAGKQVIWLGDTPDMPTSETAPQCVERAHQDADSCIYVEPEEPGQKVAAELGVPYIDMHPNFCTDDGCHVLIGGVVTFFDNNHLTLTYARTLAPYLQRSLEALVPTA